MDVSVSDGAVSYWLSHQTILHLLALIMMRGVTLTHRGFLFVKRIRSVACPAVVGKNVSGTVCAFIGLEASVLELIFMNRRFGLM